MSMAISFSTRFCAAVGWNGSIFLIALRTPSVKLKSDSGLRFLLAAFEFESKLDEKQFIEDHPYMRRRARRLQVGEAFSGIGPMRFPQCFAHRYQAQMGAHRGGNRVGQIGIQIFQRPADNAPEPAWRKFALSGGLVDGNDPSDFERGGSFLFRLVGAAFFVDVAQNLELRLHDLQIGRHGLLPPCRRAPASVRAEIDPADRWH